MSASRSFTPPYPAYSRPVSHPYLRSPLPLLSLPPPPPSSSPRPGLPSSRRSSYSIPNAYDPALPSARRQVQREQPPRGTKRANSYTARQDYDYAPSNYRIIREGGWAGMKAFMEAHGLKIGDPGDVQEAERILDGYAELDARMRGGNESGHGRRDRGGDVNERKARDDVDVAPQEEKTTEEVQAQTVEEQEEDGTQKEDKRPSERKLNHQQPAASDPDPDLDSPDESESECTPSISDSTPLSSVAPACESPGQETNHAPPRAPSPPPACPSTPLMNDSTPEHRPSEADDSEDDTSGSDGDSESESDDEVTPEHHEPAKTTASIPLPSAPVPIRASMPKLRTTGGKHVRLCSPPPESRAQRPESDDESDGYSSSDDYIGPKIRTTNRDDYIDACSSSPPSPSFPAFTLPWGNTTASSGEDESEDDEAEEGEGEGRIAGTGEYISNYKRGGKESVSEKKTKKSNYTEDWSEYRYRLW